MPASTQKKTALLSSRKKKQISRKALQLAASKSLNLEESEGQNQDQENIVNQLGAKETSESNQSVGCVATCDQTIDTKIELEPLPVVQAEQELEQKTVSRRSGRLSSKPPVSLAEPKLNTKMRKVCKLGQSTSQQTPCFNCVFAFFSGSA